MPKARVESSTVGTRIKAPKALRGLGVGSGVPLPIGERSGEGAVSLPRKFFDFLSSKRRGLVHPGCYFLQFINLN